MRKISADYVFPGNTAPIKNGVVVIDGETIEAILNPENDQIEWEDVEIFEGVLCPGFVNTHCHLELSYLKGAIEERKRLTGFIKQIVSKRDNYGETERLNAIKSAEQEMISNGIVAVGDISNGNSTFSLKSEQNMLYYTFVEVFGTNSDVAQDAIDNAIKLKEEYPSSNVSIVPHAPYSMSPRLVEKYVALSEDLICIHNQETLAENEMFEKGSGELLEIMQNFAPEMNDYKASEKSSLQSYLPKYVGSEKILLVHNTYTKHEDVEFAKKSRVEVYWCFCPNANEYIEGTQPNYSLFLNEKCTIGTDSLASNWSLSILDELIAIQQNDKSLSLELLIKWATINGAEFLGYDNKIGSIEPKKQPGINLITGIENLVLTSNSKIKKVL
jgi:cytosine/adenosine deaminase-related metal-dependent hydrolase